MDEKLIEIEAKKQELNCGVNIIPIIKYIEKLLGAEKSKKAVESLGLPLSFLMNKRNWVSHKFYKSLLEKLVEVSNDESAPFKIAFNMNNPQSIFTDLQYAAYAGIFWGNPLNMYKLTFSKDFSKRFSKIGYFEILETKNNFMKVRMAYHKGYDLHKYNLDAIRGYISFGTVSCGLEPADVKLYDCQVKNGISSCIFEIKWKRQKNRLNLISFIGITIILVAEIFFLRPFLNINFIFISLSLYTVLILIIKYLSLLKKLRFTEIFNYERNNSILEAMEKIEKNYFEINKIKLELENRNTFLTIVNEISDKITIIEDFNILLIEVSDILVKRLGFIKGTYFQINKSGEYYAPIFEINNSGITNINHSYHEMKISRNDFNKILILKKFNSIRDFKEKINVSSYFMSDWLPKNEDNPIHFIPVETYDNFAGIFCFTSESKEVIPSVLLDDLFRNISNQLQLGYERIASKSIIENILSSIPAYVLIFDIEKMNIKYINNIFIFSFPFINAKKRNKENIIGKDLFSIIPFSDSDKNKIGECLSILSIVKKTENFQVSFENKIFEYSIFSINEINKKTQYAGIILTDITETKNFEQKILINEKLLALGRVASGIAHEINNPLYVVLANAEEIAEDKNIGAETKQYAEEIIEYTVNISNIIKDLSSYSKSLRNDLVVDIDINNIIEESLKLVKYSSNFINVEILKNFSSIPKIKATKGEIEQIFINLFNNSLHAMNGNGSIEITTGCENGWLTAAVRDTGCGISEKNIPYIFDLFFTTKMADEGTGQGLHIVKKILTKYRAKIDVKSEVNVGTVFTVYFPIDDNAK
jgi:signal transduction histidine kinase